MEGEYASVRREFLWVAVTKTSLVELASTSATNHICYRCLFIPGQLKDILVPVYLTGSLRKRMKNDCEMLQMPKADAQVYSGLPALRSQVL
jgi:hypothetical protein